MGLVLKIRDRRVALITCTQLGANHSPTRGEGAHSIQFYGKGWPVQEFTR